MKKLTVKEIAKMAGVSVTAVSFVLNDRPGVSAATREKVQKIIKETGFHPNLSSKKLVKGKSYNVCLMINGVSSPFDDLFYYEIMRGILEASRKCDYNIIISRASKKGTDLPDVVYSGDVDGIIYLQNISEELTEKTIEREVPFVVVDSHSGRAGTTSVTPDYKSATETAAKYLFEKGHEKIAMLSTDAVPDFYTATCDGFERAMKDAGLVCRYKNTKVKDESGAYAAAKKLLSSSDRPSALLCTVDIFAVGAMNCAKDMGLSVPRDLSVIGIDDIILSRYIEPPLTTVGIDKVKMGELAMEMLMKKINGEPVDSILLPMTLIERKTVEAYRDTYV